MWFLNLSLLIIITLTPFLAASPDNGMQTTKEVAQQVTASLDLTTRIVRQRYCKGSDPAAHNTLRLDMQLSYKNVGQQHIILYRGSNVAYRQMISASVQDADRIHYLLDLSLMADVAGAPEIALGRGLDQSFVILTPGATFETTAATGGFLFLKRRDEEKTVDAFGTGQYVLQVQVSTFPYPRSLENELRQRWKASGELWACDVTSAPMTFKVEKDRKVVDCNP